MNRISNTARCATPLVLLGLSGGLSVLGCGAPSGTTPGEATENIGSVALELEAGGLTFDSVGYAIAGPGGYTKSGNIDVTNSTQISAVIGGIPVGTGYAITLTATDAGDSGVTCTGSTTFDVTAHETTSAQVLLVCRVPPKTGSVMVNGSIDVCPTIDTFDITPSETTVGHAVSLTASASDLDNGPFPVGYDWATSGGVLTASGGASATLTCTTPGPVTVTVVVTDGDYLCATTASQVVKCSADAVDGGSDGSDGSSSDIAGPCGDGIIDIGEACDDGNLVSGDGCSATCQLDDNLSTPGDDRAGYLLCVLVAPFDAGTMTCGPGFGCCTDSVGCAASNQQCVSPFDFQSCDGPEDCPAGMQCWVAAHSIQCAVETPYFSVFCHSNADCIKGDTTNPCIGGSCLGNPVLQGR
jgi:cysteine-rich repeat protein